MAQIRADNNFKLANENKLISTIKSLLLFGFSQKKREYFNKGSINSDIIY